MEIADLKTLYIGADELAEVMGIAQSTAYGIIRQANRELKQNGYITIAGKCPRSYLLQRLGVQP